MTDFRPETYYTDMNGPGQYSETLPPCPTVAAFSPKDDRVAPTKSGCTTNGAWEIKDAHMPNVLARRVKWHKERNHTFLSVPEDGFDDTGAWSLALMDTLPATMQFVVLRSDVGPDSILRVSSAVFQNGKGRRACYNANWIAFFSKHIPGFSLWISEPDSPAVIRSANIDVGLIMPVIAEEPLRTCLNKEDNLCPTS